MCCVLCVCATRVWCVYCVRCACLRFGPHQSLSELQSSMGQSASQAADRLARLEADCSEAKAKLGAAEAHAAALVQDVAAGKGQGAALAKQTAALQQELDSER